jgi:hypothetical protein
VVEIYTDTKELKPNSDHEVKQDKDFYRYNMAGDIVAEDRYLDMKRLALTRYRYDRKHLLSVEDFFYLGAGDERIILDKRSVSDIRTIYQYQTFDAKGNWLKRVAVRHLAPVGYIAGHPSNESIERDTVTRKITYY